MCKRSILKGFRRHGPGFGRGVSVRILLRRRSACDRRPLGRAVAHSRPIGIAGYQAAVIAILEHRRLLIPMTDLLLSCARTPQLVAHELSTPAPASAERTNRWASDQI